MTIDHRPLTFFYVATPSVLYAGFAHAAVFGLRLSMLHYSMASTTDNNFTCVASGDAPRPELSLTSGSSHSAVAGTEIVIRMLHKGKICSLVIFVWPYSSSTTRSSFPRLLRCSYTTTWILSDYYYYHYTVVLYRPTKISRTVSSNGMFSRVRSAPKHLFSFVTVTFHCFFCLDFCFVGQCCQMATTSR